MNLRVTLLPCSCPGCPHSLPLGPSLLSTRPSLCRGRILTLCFPPAQRAPASCQQAPARVEGKRARLGEQSGIQPGPAHSFALVLLNWLPVGPSEGLPPPSSGPRPSIKTDPGVPGGQSSGAQLRFHPSSLRFQSGDWTWLCAFLPLTETLQIPGDAERNAAA